MNRNAPLIAILGLLTCLLSPSPLRAQQKRIYIANDDHTDYMWTANEARYDSAFVRMLDYYLGQIEATKNNAPDFQARFNCDGSYWLSVYERRASPAQFQQLIAAIRSGHISLPLNTLVSTYGAQPTEAVIRGMYYAGQVERRFGLRLPLAVCMENQTLPLGLSSLWAGSGARYSWRGVCGCASRITNESLAHRHHQLYHYAGLDGAGVIMKWYNRVNDNGRTLGGYAEARRQKGTPDAAGDLIKVVADLDRMCDTVSAASPYRFNVAGAFGFGWDDLQTFVSPAFVQAAQATATPRLRVRVSNEEDFFEDVAKTYPHLPAETLSYGNEWDTYCASMNETTARVRRATETLRTAEALCAVASLTNRRFAPIARRRRDAAWEAFGLYWEHDWTADAPFVAQQARADWQIKLQKRISGYADSLLLLARAELGRQLGQARRPRFYVFNPLSWARDDVADFAYAGPYPVRVVDLATQREVASQLVTVAGKRCLRIAARNVPSVGYKVYELRPGTPAPVARTVRAQGEYLRNAYYQVRLSPSGAITEIVDQRAGQRPVVKARNGRYLNDLGGADVRRGRPVVVENAGPVSVTLKAVSDFPVRHTVRVTLYAGSPRIEVQDSIQQNFKDLKTWAFSFNLNAPTTHHEELGAVLTAKRDVNGGHYASTKNARFDWLTFNHFADLSEPAYGVTLSNVDCSFFRLGNSTPDSLHAQSAQLHALAGGQTDTLLGIERQNGQTQFRYQFALTTHRGAFDATTALKFSLEHQNPLTAGAVTGAAPAGAGTPFSLLTISNPQVLLWSIKPSEDGIENGLITRFWNTGPAAVGPVLQAARPLVRAWKTTHIETNEAPLTPAKYRLRLNFKPHQINTYRLQF